jgi:formate-dependent nitrite reductase membrane component NrfD
VALFILIVDLGRPVRFFLMLTEFGNLGSAMSVGAKLIAVKSFFLGRYIYLLYRMRHGLGPADQPAPVAVSRAFSVAVPALLGITSLGLAVYPAFLLARTWMSPLASTPGSGLLFLSTAMIMGAAVAVIIVAASPSRADQELRQQLVRTLLLLVVVELLLLLLAGLSLIGRGPDLARAMQDVVAGRSAAIFWGLVVATGLAVPLVGLLAMPRNRLVMLIGAAGALVGASATRYLIFVVS